MKRPHPAAATTASLSATVSDGHVFASGCGYDFVPVELHVTNTAATTETIYWAGVFADGGCFGTAFPAGPSGSYTLTAVQYQSAVPDGSGQVKAETTFQVP